MKSSQLKSIVTTIKNSLDEFNCTVEMTERKNELKDR